MRAIGGSQTDYSRILAWEDRLQLECQQRGDAGPQGVARHHQLPALE